jgi:hypothetical protein
MALNCGLSILKLLAFDKTLAMSLTTEIEAVVVVKREGYAYSAMEGNVLIYVNLTAVRTAEDLILAKRLVRSRGRDIILWDGYVLLNR